MYPTLPFGPLALPTGPVLAILAVILTLDIAGRYGRRLGIHPDDLWNVGLIALTAGLIVARLWNVFQFWYIYQSEPVLIFSIRPSGFEFWPGLVTAVIAGYVYLFRRALDPLAVAAALAVGAVAGSAVLGISGFATGTILGALSDAPWALPFFGETRHPVGLYRALGSAILCILLWVGANPKRPDRVLLQAILGYSLIRLVTDGFLAETAAIGSFRLSQVVALVVALLVVLMLARGDRVEPTGISENDTEGDTTGDITAGDEKPPV
jgi:phosphatidylglycerol---prolipoprotein diacylglyceryl transferase